MEDGEGRNKKKTTKKNKKEGNRKRPKEEKIVVKKEKFPFSSLKTQLISLFDLHCQEFRSKLGKIIDFLPKETVI